MIRGIGETCSAPDAQVSVTQAVVMIEESRPCLELQEGQAWPLLHRLCPRQKLSLEYFSEQMLVMMEFSWSILISFRVVCLSGKNG